MKKEYNKENVKFLINKLIDYITYVKSSEYELFVFNIKQLITFIDDNEVLELIINEFRKQHKNDVVKTCEININTYDDDNSFGNINDIPCHEKEFIAYVINTLYAINNKSNKTQLAVVTLNIINISSKVEIFKKILKLLSKGLNILEKNLKEIVKMIKDLNVNININIDSIIKFTNITINNNFPTEDTNKGD